MRDARKSFCRLLLLLAVFAFEKILKFFFLTKSPNITSARFDEDLIKNDATRMSFQRSSSWFWPTSFVQILHFNWSIFPRISFWLSLSWPKIFAILQFTSLFLQKTEKGRKNFSGKPKSVPYSARFLWPKKVEN